MKKNEQMLLLGAHVSIAGGFDKAIEQGESIGCTAIQIFLKSNRQWAAKPLGLNEIEQFKYTQKASSIVTVVAHSTYLVNIGASDTEINKKSVKCLSLELERCNKLGIPYLVLHPGAYLNLDPNECIELIIKNLNTILEQDTGNTAILLENTAGQGTAIGFTFEQLAYIIKRIKPNNRIGLCFDTCHAFVAGYDFRTKETYEALLQHIDGLIGLEKLKAIHLNDSKKSLGSKIDRHEHIGKGQIGLEAFRLILNDPRMYGIPKILETPHEHGVIDYEANLNILKKLTDETKKR